MLYNKDKAQKKEYIYMSLKNKGYCRYMVIFFMCYNEFVRLMDFT